MTSIRTLLLEHVDEQGASHIREFHIEILRDRPATPEHTIRARLPEAVTGGLLDRLGDGFCGTIPWAYVRSARTASTSEGDCHD